MRKTTSTEFQQNVAHFADEAQREPITVTRNGRPHMVIMSAFHFALMQNGRAAAKSADLDESTLEAIGNARMDRRHDPLNKLLEPK